MYKFDVLLVQFDPYLKLITFQTHVIPIECMARHSFIIYNYYHFFIIPPS